MKALTNRNDLDYDLARPGAPAAPQRRNPLATIWNRRWIVLFATAWCVVASFILYRLTTPVYVASRHLSVTETGALAADQVVEPPKDLFKKGAVLFIALGDPDMYGLKTLGNGHKRIESLQKCLRVDLDRDSGIITVSCESSYPAEAPIIVNKVVEAFCKYVGDMKRPHEEAVQRFQHEFDDKRTEYQKQLEQATEKKKRFLQESGLVALDGGANESVTAALNELGQELTNAHLMTVAGKTAYESAVHACDFTPEQVRTAVEAGQYNGLPIIASSDPDRIRDDLYLAQQQLVGLRQRGYLENHPSIRPVRDRVGILQATYLLSLFRQWDAARRREDLLEDKYDKQTQLARELSIKAAQYAQIEVEFQDKQRALNVLDSQFKLPPMPEEPRTMEVSPGDEATEPDAPVRPIARNYLVEGLIVGLLLGLGLTFLDGRMRTLGEVQAALGLPVLAVAPHMPQNQTPATRGRKVQLDPSGDVAEAYRRLRAAVCFGARGKTVLITSVGRGEGKSTVASNLAIAMAEAGQRVLLIDTDLREPVQHRIFAASGDSGVSSVVAGRASPQRAVQSTQVKGMDLLPCGPVPFNASETINNQAFADMLAELTGAYDFIVLDSPPVAPVTDARILGAMCDATVLVVRAERTSRRAAIDARDGLLGFGARVLGVVVNDGARSAGSLGDGGGGGGAVPAPSSTPTATDRRLMAGDLPRPAKRA